MDPNNDNRGIDLSHVFDDSNNRIKSKSEESQRLRSFETQTPKIVRLVIKFSGGLIKDERQASYVLIGFVLLAIVASVSLFFGGGGEIGNQKDIKILPAEF